MFPKSKKACANYLTKLTFGFANIILWSSYFRLGCQVLWFLRTCRLNFIGDSHYQVSGTRKGNLQRKSLLLLIFTFCSLLLLFCYLHLFRYDVTYEFLLTIPYSLISHTFYQTKRCLIINEKKLKQNNYLISTTRERVPWKVMKYL